MRKTGKCAGGGYRALQLALLEGEEIKCEDCRNALQDFDITPEKFEAALLQGMDAPANQEDMPINAEKKKEEEEEDPQAKKRKSLDPFAWVRTLAPVIVQLPPGSHGRVLPFRCTVCKTRGQREGKILEGHEAKEAILKYFIGKHLKTSGHQHRMQSQEEPMDQERVVDCQGLLGFDGQVISNVMPVY